MYNKVWNYTMGEKWMFSVGEKIIYGENGVCTVSDIGALPMDGGSGKV